MVVARSGSIKVYNCITTTGHLSQLVGIIYPIDTIVSVGNSISSRASARGMNSDGLGHHSCIE